MSFGLGEPTKIKATFFQISTPGNSSLQFGKIQEGRRVIASLDACRAVTKFKLNYQTMMVEKGGYQDGQRKLPT